MDQFLKKLVVGNSSRYFHPAKQKIDHQSDTASSNNVNIRTLFFNLLREG